MKVDKSDILYRRNLFTYYNLRSYIMLPLIMTILVRIELLTSYLIFIGTYLNSNIYYSIL